MVKCLHARPIDIFRLLFSFLATKTRSNLLLLTYYYLHITVKMEFIKEESEDSDAETCGETDEQRGG